MSHDVPTEDDAPPRTWVLTAFARSTWDFEHMLQSEHFGGYFRSVEGIKDLLSEQKSLMSKVNVLYLLTFLGAIFVLMGPLPGNANVSVLGVSIPVGAIPVQIVAVVMATVYGMFATAYSSLFLLNSMVAQILRKEGAEAWPFLAARFDASMVWTVLILPRVVGYQSPRRHRMVGALILLMSVLSVFAHMAVIEIASWVALVLAFRTGGFFVFLCGGLAFAISTVAIAALLSAAFLKLPFRLPEDSEGALDR